MLMQQWILARSEMREFLGGRPMVPYPEAWMDRVDAMKKLQNWTDVSVIHFGDLARFGEQLLLSIRYGNWSDLHDSTFAANWARDFRAEVSNTSTPIAQSTEWISRRRPTARRSPIAICNRLSTCAAAWRFSARNDRPAMVSPASRAK